MTIFCVQLSVDGVGEENSESRSVLNLIICENYSMQEKYGRLSLLLTLIS